MAKGRLSITPPLGETAVHTLDAPQIILGRSPQADITIPDPLISQQHARITSKGDALFIEDLGSTNGIFLNGLRLTPGIPVPLPDGARLEMGDTALEFSAAPLMPLDATLVTRSPLDDTLITQPETTPWLKRWGPAAGLALLGIIAIIAAILLWQRGDTPPPEITESTTTPTPAEPDELPPPAVTRTRIDPCPEPPLLPVVPPSFTAVAANAPANPTQFAIPLLELPFPYDGGNENFGGTDAQFRTAVQRTGAGGRINSFFDHFYPLYPAPADDSLTFGREPAAAPIGGNILLFDGQLSGGDYYSGHPAFDFATFIPRQPTTPVFAAADGVVYDVGEHSSGALYVKLVHDVPDVGSFLTIYWHLHPDEFYQAMTGRIGEPIAAGTRIGTMGNTGWSTGHHLHFEVRFDRNGDGAFAADESVDPFGFIPSPAYPADPWGQPASFTDARGNPYNHAASISPYLWVHPLGTAVQIPDSGGGQIPQTGMGGEGLPSICAPARSLPPGSTLFYSYATDPAPMPELAGAGEGCVLSAIAPDGSPVTAFDTAVRVELPYAPADYTHLDPDTVAIYWQDVGSSDWYPLPTLFDEEQGIAAAETSKPGHCALLGQPLQDMTPPHTSIEISGERGVDGAFYDRVTVSATANDAGGVAKIEYSLDAGTTWQLYTGPFTILANGIPEPLPPEMEEDFGSGPGRFLVLFSTTDTAGNVEEPPAFRRIVIDPSKAPPPETTPTPTFTITPSPTACVPMVTAVLNANVRWGPGLIYDPPVAALAVGESAPILGKNSDASWWQIDLNANAATQFWVADSVVEINCGREDVPVAATPIPPTFTPTPTDTPTPTPTSTPTITPTPTRTRIPDKQAPIANASHAPTQVWENTQVTFTATAQDNVGVTRIEIWIRPSANAVWFNARTCFNTTFCTYLGGPYTPGTVDYIAYAWDAANNIGNSGQISFSVLSIPK